MLFLQVIYANTVSNLKGELSVNQGALNYNVPLSLPVGTAGVKPSVSLSYNSNGSNGYMGIGWNISAGQSAITRCGKTIALDGKVQGVKYNSSDNICLDGQRLVLISGTKWHTNSEYRTKVDNYSKIVYDGTNFKVWTKAGDIKEYKLYNQTWLLLSIKDRYNNTISYNYSSTPNETYLSSITYADNKVQLNYENKKDQFHGYTNGRAFKITKRVKSIDIKSANKTLRTYRLVYNSQSSTLDKSSLKSITECSGGVCLEPLHLQYNKNGNITFKNYDSSWLRNGYGGHSYNYVTGSNSNGTYSALIDMNGDGLPDRVGHYNYNTRQHGIWVALNTGNGFGSYKKWMSAGQGQHKDNYVTGSNSNGTYSALVDMNGDGLPDRVGHYNYNTRQHGIWVALNTGNGFGSYKKWMSAGQGQHKDNYVTGSNSNGTYSALIDMNGDGLPDRVGHHNYRTNTKGLHVALNTGNGFGEYKLWLRNGYGGHSYNYVTGSNSNGTYSALIDMNGDGLPDRVGHHNYRTNTKGLHVALNSKMIGNKVISITDSFKNTTTINYKRLNEKSNSIYKKYTNSRYPDRDIISPMQVVESVTSYGANNTLLKTSYKYEGLKTNLKGLGSYGFAKVTTTNHLNNSKTITNYRQDYPFVGMPKDSYSYLGDELQSKATYTYNKSKQKVGSYTYKGFYHWKIVNKTGYYYTTQIQNIKQNTTTYQNGSPLTTTIVENKNYDNYGNIQEVISKIIDNTTGEEFVKTTYNTYENDEYSWILARLTNARVVSQAYGDTKTKESSFTYDSQKGTLLSETIEPNSDKWLKKSYAYDSKGNKISETIHGANLPSRITTTSYDSLGKFAIKTTNPLGHSESKTYNADGQIISLTGPNGLTTKWEYDNFGKKIKENRADGTSTTYNYSWDNTFGSLYKITIASSGKQPLSTYYNKLGKSVRTQKIGFDGKTIIADTHYNNYGLVSKKSTPYFNGTQPEFSYIYYDKHQRPIKQIDPAPNNQEAIQTISYDGFTTIVTDAKGYEKKTTKNALGKTTYIEEEEGGYQEYQYDANGALIKTIDSQGNEIVLNYDIFGNKTYQNDPDMGEWYYTYNSLGQLTSQKDAKNQTTTMQYDILGRKVKETNGDGISTWEYDTTYKGKLHKESKPNYAKVYIYDRYGRVIQTITTIDNVPYTQTYSYDSVGRMIEKTLPNNFKVKNIFNQYGYLESIKSPVSQIKDFDEEHFVNLIDKILTSSIYYYKRQLEYDSKAKELEKTANYYKELAQHNKNEKQKLLGYAQELENYAIQYTRYATQYKSTATSHKATADMYLRLSKRGGFFGRFFRKTYTRLSKTYEQYANEHIALSQQNLEQAANYKKSATQTVTSAETFTSDIKYYTQLVDNTINEYKTALAIAKNYQEKAKDNHTINKHYQTILDDKEHNYFYKVLQTDSFGRVTKYLSGNGLITNKEYSTAGYLEKITTGYSFEEKDIRHLTFEYDKLSNVTNRSDHILKVYQNYTYDRLNRVTNAYTDTKQNSTTMSYEYDTLGNITYKSDIGAFSYSHTNPHQVIQAGDKTFTYDKNGNQINNNGTKIEYTSYNKANKLITKNDTITFNYDTSKFRYKKQSDNYTTHYIGKEYEATTHKSGGSDMKYFIYAGDKVISIYTDTTKSNFAPSTKYLHYDSLNSVDTITNNLGVVESRSAYKPFGEKLKLDKYGNPTQKLSFTNRGYTGHEHIEETHLVHMNARLYDPTIGRFTSADSMIPYMYETQSFNRYSYVQNNPLKYTDPSGHWSLRKAVKKARSFVKKHWKTIVTIAVVVAVGIATGGAGLALAGSMGLTGTVAGTIVAGATAGAIAGFAGGMVGTRLHGGSWKDGFKAGMKGALVGAVSGGFAAGVAEGTAAYFNIGSKAAHSASFFSGGSTTVAAFKAVAHGISRAMIAKAQGNNARSAFLSGFMSSGFSVGTKGYGGVFGRTMIMAGVAGTVSQATGGKFSNGAMTGAFVHLFNAENIGQKFANWAVKSYYNARQNFVNALQTVNTASTYMAVANGVVTPNSYFWDGTVVVSEAGLILMGEQGTISSTINALNGGTIDTITPKGPYGPFIGQGVKEITRINNED
jgi:RHS repeat-associated protein